MCVCVCVCQEEIQRYNLAFIGTRTECYASQTRKEKEAGVLQP